MKERKLTSETRPNTFSQRDFEGFFHFENESFVVTDHLSIVEDTKFIFSEFGNPFDFEATGGSFDGKHRNLNGILFADFFGSMFAGIFKCHGSKLTLRLFVVVVRITDMNIHDQSSAVDDLEPASLARIIDGESKYPLCGCSLRGRGFRGSSRRLSGGFSFLFHSSDGDGFASILVVAINLNFVFTGSSGRVVNIVNAIRATRNIAVNVLTIGGCDDGFHFQIR